MIKAILGKLFGSANDKMLKKYDKNVQIINSLESKFQNLSDDELKAQYSALRAQVWEQIGLQDFIKTTYFQNLYSQNNPDTHSQNSDSQNAEFRKALDAIDSQILQNTLDSVLNECFAITREASKRTLNMRHFDVQLIGGMALHNGQIAEMKTGEGKTLVATLAVCLNALSGKRVDVVTVNDYLARRDGSELEPLYNFLGLKVGIITSDMRDDEAKLEAYSSNVVYGTNNEFGFDYLRDNMKYSLAQKVQKHHFFAIVDEVDSILIDEARTPLIISAPVNRTMEHYHLADSVAQKLKQDEDFNIDEKNRVILLSEDGIKNAEKLFGVENLYALENAALSHHLDQALKANYLFIKDKDYVVKDGEVVIVDEFTGRLSEGRRFSEGLHQAIEAKEKVDIKEESQTLADITFQNYFRLYGKLAGMTGTAQTEAAEFLQIYNLEVVSIPTNLPIARKDLNDLIYKTQREKFEAVIKKITELYKKGQPVLVGTASIERSEVLHELLKQARIPHTVLNAKQHEKEAQIIKDAGLKGSVTIATNMAGRGVDIKISDEIRELGGLYIIGTERHESRRIDNQLRGRAGRQGDPGVSQFYLSLEDSLIRIFGGDKLKVIMERLGLTDGEHIESGLVTKSVQNAQKKVEALHFESRKHLLEYDDVANEQRKAIYKLRDELLDSEFDISSRIEQNREAFADYALEKAGILAHDVAENFDLNALKASIQEDMGVQLDDLQNLEFDDLRDKILHTLQEQYESKFANFSKQQRSEIERIVYLQVLDNAWREHLYTMDNLKTGIGLRGYNQKDPLVEYKKESYNLFLEFAYNLKIETAKTLQIVKFKAQDSQNISEMKEKMEEELEAEQLSFNKDDAQSDINGNKIAAKKVARNDPCPCGSGKKYKQCHGKSGPKKGMLA